MAGVARSAIDCALITGCRAQTAPHTPVGGPHRALRACTHTTRE